MSRFQHEYERSAVVPSRYLMVVALLIVLLLVSRLQYVTTSLWHNLLRLMLVQSIAGADGNLCRTNELPHLVAKIFPEYVYSPAKLSLVEERLLDTKVLTPEGQLMLGLVAALQKKHDVALANLADDTVCQSRREIAHYVSAYVYAQQRDWVGVVHQLRAARDVPHLLLFTTQLLESGEGGVARLGAEGLVALEPGKGYGYCLLARALLLSGEEVGAQECLEDGIRAEPAYLWNYLSLGDLYLRQDDCDAAWENYAAARTISPTYPSLVWRLKVWSAHCAKR